MGDCHGFKNCLHRIFFSPSLVRPLRYHPDKMPSGALLTAFSPCRYKAIKCMSMFRVVLSGWRVCTVSAAKYNKVIEIGIMVYGFRHRMKNTCQIRKKCSLMYRPITVLCINSDVDKQMDVLVNLLI